MKSRLRSVQVEPPNPIVPFPNLFYWVYFSQSFVSDPQDIYYKKEGRPFGFASYDAFGKESDPDDCSYLCDPNDFKYKWRKRKKNCCSDYANLGVESGIDFEVCLFQEMPWIFNLNAGGGICHESVVRKIQSVRFRGIESLKNRNSKGDHDSAKYYVLTTSNYVNQIVERVIDEQENFCPQCGYQPLICDRCTRRRCLECTWGNKSNVEVVEKTNWTNFMPIQLASWNGEDMVSGAVDTIVTGRLLKFMIDEQLTPFGYGPMAVDAHGAKQWQLEFAEEAKHDVELRFEIE